MGHTVVQVLDFLPRYPKRSGEQVLVLLAERLRSKGWRTVHVFGGEPEISLQRRFRELDSPWIVVPFPLTCAGAKALAADLRQYHPDVIQSTFISPFNPALWMLKRHSGARYLVLNDNSSNRPSRKGPLKRMLARLRGRWAAGYIDHIIAVSDFVRERDIHDVFLPASKIRVVHHGVNMEQFVPMEKTESEALTIAFAGQLIPEKGVLCLLQAVCELLREHPSLPLKVRIAGEGHQSNELRQYCIDHELSQVEFLGHIDWVARLFAQADVVAIPSEWEEALGLVEIEAMGCGACVIGSDAGAIPEALGTDGQAGLIFKRGDVSDLKQKLYELLMDRDRRQRMGAAARQRAVELFTIQRMVEGYLQVYNEIEADMAGTQPGSHAGERREACATA
ncbi:MAG: glycosyltransferase family 4 protein [Bacillota bacterium]